MNRAPFLLRTLAFFLDLFVVSIVWFALFCAGVTGYLFGLQEPGFASFVREWDRFFATFLSFSLFAFFFYFTYLTAYGEKTVGKTLFGIKVVKTDGEPPGYLRSFLRCICYGVSWVPFLLGFLLALLLKGRSMHDILAGTIVIKEE